MKYCLYIIYSGKFDKYYIGQTNNLPLRLKRHNGGRSKSTKHYRPWKLLFEKRFNSRSEAMRLERYLKSLKNKERLLQWIAGWRSSIPLGAGLITAI